jgi:hypothetical protein
MSRDKVDSAGMLCNEDGADLGHNVVTALELTLLGLLLSGCAVSPAPESIRASYVSSIPYQSRTCSQLRQEQSALDAALTSTSAQEEQIRSNERVQSALTMVGVPFLADTGSSNVTSQVEIARLKGEQEAVRQAVAHNSCPTQESRVTTPAVSRGAQG